MCGNVNDSNELYCGACMDTILGRQALKQGSAVTVRTGSSDGGAPLQEEFAPEKARAQPAWVYGVVGVAAFSITIYLMVVGLVTYNVAKVVRDYPDGVIVTPADSAALRAAENDSGRLRVFRSGDTWTYSFTRHTQNDLGTDTYGHGDIVETMGLTSVNGADILTDTTVFTTLYQNKPVDHQTYVAYLEQTRSGDLYELGTSDGPVADAQWNAQPVLFERGDLNRSASFDDVLDANTQSHLTVTVDPGVISRKLSTGTPVQCWNQTRAYTNAEVTADTSSELFCPAIGQILSEKEVTTIPDDGTRTVDSYLRSYSFSR